MPLNGEPLTPHSVRIVRGEGMPTKGTKGCLRIRFDIEFPRHLTDAQKALLQQALQVAQTHRNLSNEVMRERAQWLLNTLDDRF